MSVARHLREDSLAIFLFHGVVEEHVHGIRNYTRKHLHKDFFASCLAELNRSGRSLGMDDVVEHCRAGEPFPPNSFAVTFDDGFENNFSIAAPMLGDACIPTTFYVTTGFVDANAMSWIDRIEYAVEQALVQRGSATLRLSSANAPIHIGSVPEAMGALDMLRAEVKRAPDLDVERLVASIFEQCRITPITASDDPLDRKMSWQQVAALQASPDFLVGGHTHTHAIMSFLSPADLEAEIDTSLGLLREKAGVSSRHYSYPEGLAHCYNSIVIDQLERRGVVCCPTAIEGTNTAETGLFHLRRIMVG